MILIIDTSSNMQYISLVLDDQKTLVDEVLSLSKNDHSSSLLVNIDNIIKKNHFSIEKITKIIVGIGPGSYTGTRVGLVIAKSLAYSLNIPLYQISSLILLSSGYENNVLVMFDAKREHYFSVLHNDGKILLEEKNREKTDLEIELKTFQYTLVNENNIKVNYQKIIKLAVETKNIHTLSPNYLKEV